MKISKKIKRQARQLFRFCIVNGTVDDQRVRRAVDEILRRRRRGYIEFLSQFQRLLQLDHAAHTATVESAIPLPQDLQSRMEAGVQQRYGTGVNTRFYVQPSLIAGVRIQVGSELYDGSLQSRLQALQATL